MTKPVAWMVIQNYVNKEDNTWEMRQVYHENYHPDGIPLYDNPREWKGLSDKAKLHFIRNAPEWSTIELIEAIEEELRGLNNE